MKREKEAILGNCIREITHDCKDMLRKKLKEIDLYNSTISQNRNRKQKFYMCRQRGHTIKNCPMKEKEHGEGTKMAGNTSIMMKGRESAKLMNKKLMTTKPTVSLKYPEWIHFLTKCMIKGEVVVKNGDQWYLIPGVHYAPEVTLNILSIDLLESQGIEIIYEDNICRLIYMFSNLKDHKLNEDKLRTMQNEYLEKYFESLKKRDTSNEGVKPVGMLSMKDDSIEIKGTIYSTRVNTFNEYVGFLNLLKQDEIISQAWDAFRNKFDKPWGYLSVYFARDFGKIGKILGLSIQDEEEVRRCYINFLDVFTSYHKTARVPKQEHNRVLGMPTKIVEEGKEYTCLASHQCDFAEIKAPNMEVASRKGKEKIKHFRIILEDTRRESDSHLFQPIPPNIKRSQNMNKDIQGMIKRPTNS
uniref:ARID DNA-binding domain-containing protein n=1 Tax=Tanacetum cinerariifolium TaxID=118510 RepID=A0A6L2KPR4_TANCI|nr:ARID DNA-binding domain-containing protein [Tanacetum cinerariifolium]